jgi:hypothetical protein
VSHLCNPLCVTLAATWCSYERPESPTLWMATDSRISDATGKVIDEGIKLYEVPVVCREPGPRAFFDTPYFQSSIGMVAAGGSLVYQHVYGTLVPVLGNLVHPTRAVPSTTDLAEYVSRVTTTYVRSLGHVRPEEARRITIIVGGRTPGLDPEAYHLQPRLDDEGMIEYPPEPLSLGAGDVRFIGTRVEDAKALHDAYVERDRPGASRHRAALNVIRTLIEDPEAPTIGGEVQIGFTVGHSFRRATSVVADRKGAQARMLLNSIDLDSLGPVGPCAPGLVGMISP